MPNMKALALTICDKKIYKVFFFRLPWQPDLFTEFKSMNHSESAPSKDYICEAGFRGEDFLSNCSRTDGRTDGLTGRTFLG